MILRSIYFSIFLLFLVSQFGTVVEAGSRKKEPLTRDQLTTQQRAQIMVRARKLCKEKEGPTSVVYRLEIKKTSFTVRCSAY